MMVTVSSAPIRTQTFGSKTPAASALLVSPKPGRYPPTSSAPPAALTFKKVRLVSVFVICHLNLWLRPIGLAFAAAHEFMAAPYRACIRSRSCLRAGRAMNSAADPLICSASADVTRHGGINIGIGWFRFLREQRCGRHQLTRLTVATLRYLLGNPSDLQRMARCGRKSFDRCDLLRSHIRYRHPAGPDGHAVKLNRAGSALLQTAPELGPSQANRVAYHPEQWRVRAPIHVILFSIYR